MESERLSIEIGPYCFVFIPMPTKKGIKPFCVSEKTWKHKFFLPFLVKSSGKLMPKPPCISKNVLKTPRPKPGVFLFHNLILYV